MPERIQLSRAKGWRMPENTVIEKWLIERDNSNYALICSTFIGIGIGEADYWQVGIGFVAMIIGEIILQRRAR